MNTPVWLVLGVATLVAVHMGILLYLYRATATESGTRSTEAVDAHRERRPHDERLERTVCPACGAPNDPTYRFCRRCISDLSAGKTTASGDGPTERLGS